VACTAQDVALDCGLQVAGCRIANRAAEPQSRRAAEPQSRRAAEPQSHSHSHSSQFTVHSLSLFFLVLESHGGWHATRRNIHVALDCRLQIANRATQPQSHRATVHSQSLTHCHSLTVNQSLRLLTAEVTQLARSPPPTNFDEHSFVRSFDTSTNFYKLGTSFVCFTDFVDERTMTGDRNRRRQRR